MTSPGALPPGYRALGVLGRGGMGVVLHAQHASGVEVALKQLLLGPRAGQAQRARFRRELEALRKLDHPSVVRVLDGGETPEGVPWFAMKLVAGESLEGRLRRGPLPIPDAFDLALQLASALTHAHAHGLLHRDLKPDNLLLERGPVPRWVLTDFGLTKDLLTEHSQELSRSGVVFGTPGYWAPEQAAGQPSGPATDVYGFGALVYAALTGHPPVEGRTFVEAIVNAQRQAPRPLRSLRPEVPAPFAQVIARCLEKDPARRYPDAGALAEALEASAAPPAGRGRAGLALALAALAALTAWVFTREPVADPAERPTPARSVASSSPAAPSPRPPALSPEDARALVVRASRIMGGFEGEHDLLLAERLLEEAAAAGDEVATPRLIGLLIDREPDFDKAADHRAARRAIERGLARGELRALNARAVCVGSGLAEYPKDAPRARELFYALTEHGEYMGLYSGLMLEPLEDRPAVARRLLPQLQRAAAEGNPSAALALALLHMRGLGVSRDRGRIEELLAVASAGSSAQAWTVQGQVLLDRAPERGERAHTWLRRGAEAGDRFALYLRGRAFCVGLPQGRLDVKAGVENLRLAARLGEQQAMIDYADALYGGWAGPRQIVASLRWSEVLARLGNPAGFVHLGVAHFAGIGRTRDPAKGVELFQRAADLGHPDGRHGLALARVLGVGIERDLERGIREFEALEAEGNIEATFSLGTLYSNGDHVAKDLRRGRAYHEKAGQLVKGKRARRGPGGPLPPPERAQEWLAPELRLNDALRRLQQAEGIR